jgi:hypothetical protein
MPIRWAAELEGSEYLYTVAEVSVAFVGFAAIVIAVRPRSGDLSEFERQHVTWLVERGLAALAFSLLPMLVHYFGAQSRSVLPLSSALLAGYLLSILARNFLIFRAGTLAKSPLSASGFASRLAMVGLMIPIQALAALGALPFDPLGWYLFGASWLLVLSGILFATVLTGRAV